MKNVFLVLAIAASFLSCKDKEEKGKFVVNGEMKNMENQRVFLEQLFFSQQNPQSLDTADVVNGKFSVSTVASEEGLYRLRFEKNEAGYIFINDATPIDFKADFKDLTLQGSSFSTPGNRSFKEFLTTLDGKRKAISDASAQLENLKTTKNNDSLVAVETNHLTQLMTDYKSYLLKTVQTSSSPNIAMFAIGSLDMETLKTAVPALVKRFPQHQGVTGLNAQFNQALTQQNQPQANPSKSTIPGIGAIAPDFSMADTAGKPFSLSQLRGKYVLVDFWASWCGPCRGENPNVVAAYNKYKNKNFTILGVSLDENKAAWLKAIKDDKLAWKQVSDLKGWSNATVPLYGYEGIPYNVLLDPQGKIIATELREAALEQKLAEVLK